MSEPLSLLNLDNSYPIEDPNHATNFAGTLRFINGADQNGLDAMNRLQGDVQHKFVLFQDKLNSLVEAWNSNPELSTFDNTPYALIDGSHPFTSPQAGVAPTAGAHMVTKTYTDDAIGGLQSLLDSNVLAIQGVEQQTPKISSSEFVEHIWQSGIKQKLQFSMLPASPNLEFMVMFSLIEKLDIAQPSAGDPNPDPEIVYRCLSPSGTKHGFFADDMWLESPNVLNVLVPNNTLFPQDYDSSADYVPVTNPRQRWLKAVVLTSQADPTLSTDITYKRGLTTLVDGQDWIDIVFPEAFSSTPTRFDVSIVRPSDSSTILSWAVNKDSISEEGFRVGFSPAPDEADYQVLWSAFL